MDSITNDAGITVGQMQDFLQGKDRNALLMFCFREQDYDLVKEAEVGLARYQGDSGDDWVGCYAKTSVHCPNPGEQPAIFLDT